MPVTLNKYSQMTKIARCTSTNLKKKTIHLWSEFWIYWFTVVFYFKCFSPEVILIFVYLVTQIYQISLDTPYFKFVRDSLSFVVLLGLHFALCLEPSSVPFSGLEWAILVFFIGRYLVEREQIFAVIHSMKRQRNSGDDGNLSNILLKAFLLYQR